ncbi:MAG: ferrous iron transport protein A [Acidobacteriota bacterium]|nr:ferrous iron transport protein A [Blastocatellia bacterium]MDW8412756.1 ferrous iron transport protein A [Acidobacteriota bacterium]
MTLVDAVRSKWYRIAGVEASNDERRRLLELGLTPGTEVCVVQEVPFGDPLIVQVRGARLALRKREAEWVKLQ